MNPERLLVAKVDLHADADAGVGVEANAVAGVGVGAAVIAVADADAGTNAVAVADADAGTNAVAVADADAGTNAVAVADADAGTNAVAVADADAGANAVAVAGAVAGDGPGAVAEDGPGAVAVAVAEAGAVAGDGPEADVDRVFHALADATRRDIIARTMAQEQSVSSLAEHYTMSFAAVQKHVAVLERALLVSKVRRGREQIVHGNPATLRVASHLIRQYEQMWAERAQRITRLLSAMDETATEEPPQERPTTKGTAS
jgi:DNA-binding transcriptional ArsR family regulator